MPDLPTMTISLDSAASTEAELLANLLELYIHDMSAAFPRIALGPDGRYGYPRLPLYWSEPDRHFPFLIRCGGIVAGFALATRGSPASDDPTVLDIAEFFVLRRYRRSGVGGEAAIQLWNRLPGKWTVRASEGLPSAVAFWSNAIAEFTNGSVIETRRPGNPNDWRVFSFESHERGEIGVRMRGQSHDSDPGL